VGENLEVFDHVTVGVYDRAASARFYDELLAPLGAERHEGSVYVEWGDLSIAAGRPVSTGVRVTLTAPEAPLAERADPDGTVVGAVVRDGRPPASIDTVTLAVVDIAAARRFYETVLPVAPRHDDRAVMFGDVGGTLRLALGPDPTRALHVAFAAATNAEVDAFWRAGVDAGFESNGAPGERPQYHAGYYGAFLLDPAGNNVEAVCHNR